MIRIIVTSVMLCVASVASASDKCLILLHGLSRSTWSMTLIGDVAAQEGYQVVNLGYPSRSAEISELSEEVIPDSLAQCESNDINFVTHSMGGILLRDYYARHKDAKRPTRTVMLAPPNQGSAIVDDPRYDEFGAWWMGPAGKQLSEDPNSFVNNLPPVDYPVGVIAGDLSVNPYFSSVLKGDNDGAVSVIKTAVEGMDDWIVIHASHSFMMYNLTVLDQTIYYLNHGQFDKPAN